MRILLRLLAIGLLLGAVIWWVRAGSHPGWTKNKVFVEKVDEFTGVSYLEEEERFVPGVDFLAAAGGVSLLLGGLSFLRRRQPKSTGG
jgi:hypothetical protein